MSSFYPLFYLCDKRGQNVKFSPVKPTDWSWVTWPVRWCKGHNTILSVSEGPSQGLWVFWILIRFYSQIITWLLDMFSHDMMWKNVDFKEIKSAIIMSPWEHITCLCMCVCVCVFVSSTQTEISYFSPSVVYKYPLPPLSPRLLSLFFCSSLLSLPFTPVPISEIPIYLPTLWVTPHLHCSVKCSRKRLTVD